MLAVNMFGKTNELKARSPAMYTLLMMIVFGLAAVLLSGLVLGLATVGVFPAVLVITSVHSLGAALGFDTYQPPTSWILLLIAAFLACYVWNRWLQPVVAVRMWIYNINHFHPNYGPKPENLDRYLARHPNALKYPR